MLLDNNMFVLKMNKYNMKQNKKIYLLAFHRDEEQSVVRALTGFTRNFVLLLTNNNTFIKRLLPYKSIFCTGENIQCKLKCIYTNEDVDTEDFQFSTEFLSYILFIKEDKLNSTSYSSYFSRCYNFLYLLKKLEEFNLYDFYFLDGMAVIRLSNQKNQKRIEPIAIIQGKKEKKEKKIFLSPFLGIGDYFLEFSIIQEYCLQRDEEIYFPVVDFIPIMNSKIYFKNYNKIYFDNEAMFNFCFSIEHPEIINIFSSFQKNNYFRDERYFESAAGHLHITKVVQSILGFHQSIDVYKHNDLLTQWINATLNRSEKEYIDSMFSGKKVIGIQFFSGIHEEKNDLWKTDLSRIWSEMNIQRFLDACSERKYTVISLIQLPYKIEGLISLDNLSVEGYAYAISKLSLMVGIDSSAGHIAAFFDIPSITVWGKHTPFIPEHHHVSFRPLRKNISIYSPDCELDWIQPKYVAKIVDGFFNGEYKFNNKRNDIENQDFIINISED